MWTHCVSQPTEAASGHLQANSCIKKLENSVYNISKSRLYSRGFNSSFELTLGWTEITTLHRHFQDEDEVKLQMIVVVAIRS